MSFSDDVRDPLQFATHVPDCLCLVSFRRYRPLKLPLSREIFEKGGFGAPDLYGEVWGGDTTNFGHAFLNRTC